MCTSLLEGCTPEQSSAETCELRRIALSVGPVWLDLTAALFITLRKHKTEAIDTQEFGHCKGIRCVFRGRELNYEAHKLTNWVRNRKLNITGTTYPIF
jgi:hypothetical protein